MGRPPAGKIQTWLHAQVEAATRDTLEEEAVMDDEPRAYTPEEVRDMLIEHVRATARYWATLPDTHNATGRAHTVLDRCEGVAFSILATLDGCSMSLPAMTLRMDPHPDDKEFLKGEGENWFEPGTEVSTMLHEFFDQKAPATTQEHGTTPWHHMAQHPNDYDS